jgi:hypothetical protein
MSLLLKFKNSNSKVWKYQKCKVDKMYVKNNNKVEATHIKMMIVMIVSRIKCKELPKRIKITIIPKLI